MKMNNKDLHKIKDADDKITDNLAAAVYRMVNYTLYSSGVMSETAYSLSLRVGG